MFKNKLAQVVIILAGLAALGLSGCALDPNPTRHEIGQAISMTPVAINTAELNLVQELGSAVLIKAFKSGSEINEEDDAIKINFYEQYPNKVLYSFLWGDLREMFKKSSCSQLELQLLSNASNEALVCNRKIDLNRVKSVEVVKLDGSKMQLTSWLLDSSHSEFSVIQLAF